jgi:hypothetical protein
VLLPRRPGAPVAASVAPGNSELGLMPPYTPLHHLLLRQTAGPIVLTSGNVSDEPIVYRDADALTRLAGIADAFLAHDRAIHIRTDDSVVRPLRGTVSLLAGYSAGVLVGAPIAARRATGEGPWPPSVTMTLLVEFAVLAAFSAGWELTGPIRAVPPSCC